MSEQVRIQWTTDRILDFLHDHAETLQAMGVVKIGLFGSYVRGEQTSDSDMDFLVQMRSPAYRDFMNVLHFLEDHFNCKIDLGEEHLLKPAMRPVILREVKYAEGF